VTASIPAGVIRGPDGYPVFDLPMRGGHAYDIDVEPGRAPTVNGGQDAETDDLYRSAGEEDLDDWQLYASRAPNRSIRPGAFRQMSEQAVPADCLTLGADLTGADSIDADFARVGAKACVRTSESRWALITVTGLPGATDPRLRIKVVLLRR
jgi:hypothetical protein